MHIHVHLDRNDQTKTRVMIDDVDVTNHVLARGFKVDLAKVDGGELAIPHVHVIFKPNTLTVDGDVLIDVSAPDADPEVP